MTRRVLISYLALTALVVLVLALPLGLTLARSERARLVAAVERDATVLAGLVEDALEHGDPVDFDAVATTYADRTGARVVIVDAAGLAVGDSRPLSTAPRDFSTRPEIADALSGRMTSGDRYSETLQEGLLYVAVPVTSGGRVHGALRITYPTATVEARIRRGWLTLAFVAGVALLAAGVVGVALARSVTRPVAGLLATARRLAAGDLSARAADHGAPTELAALAAALNGMADRLQVLIDSQRDFVADASHQLRSPLTALRLRLEGLEDLEPGNAEQLEAAVDEAARLGRLVEGLLTLARAEGTQVAPVPVSVAAVLTERADAWRPFAEERGVRLLVVADPGNAKALPGALEQIVDNYLANALRVAPPDTAVQLRGRRAARQGHMIVSVTDEGPGMAPDQRTRAFDRFWRGTADDEGFGLGLAVVRRLATASGGRAELRTGPTGRGTEAMVELPLAVDAPAPLGPRQREPAPT